MIYRYLLLLLASFLSVAVNASNKLPTQPESALSSAVSTQLFFNANGYTLTSSGELQKFTCLVTQQGKVVSVLPQCSATQYPQASHHDMAGKTLLPGLIDAHGHVIRLGESLMQVDVRGFTSKQAILSAVKQYAAEQPQHQWLTGIGWNQVLWSDKKFPTYRDLDSVISDRPVWLTRVDGHAGWANKKAMELAGINGASVSPQGGKIVRDKNGEPTGVFIDNAMALIEHALPKSSEAYTQQALDLASQHLLSLGITATHDAGVDYQQYLLYQKNANQGQLKLRFYPMLSATDKKLEQMLDNGYITDPNDFLSIRSVKVYGDGALGSRGAAMIDVYSDARHENGLLVTPEAELPGLFKTILEHGFQLNYHAIGDRANRLALVHFAKSYQAVGGKQQRNRIEHAQVIHPSDIKKFKQLDLIASMQPIHATSDKNMAQYRIGPVRMVGAYAWQTMLKQGTVLAAGSDYPIEYANVFHGLHASVTRQDRQNKPEGGWFSAQSLSLKQAFRAFTLDAAFAAHQEQKIGSLEAQKWADFIIVDQDIFTIPEKNIWRTQVLQTWVAGELAYQR